MDKWQDSFEFEDEDLRHSPALERYKTVEAALASIPEASAYRGSSVRIPPPDATPEILHKWDADMMEKVPGLVRMPSPDDAEDTKRFWGTLGVPEDKTGYTAPEGTTGIDDATMEELVNMSESVIHTGDQHDRFILGMSKLAEANATAQAEAKEEHTNELKKLWGTAYPDNIAITDNMAEKFAGKDMPLSELNNSARIWMLNVANALSSDPQVFNQVNTPNKGRTPDEIRNRVDDIRGLLMDKSVFGDKRKKLLKEQNKLYEELDRYA